MAADAVPAAVIGALIIAWAIALGVLHGSGSAWMYALLFGALPFGATLATAPAGTRGAAAPKALWGAGIGLASWIVVAVLFAAKFAD